MISIMGTVGAAVDYCRANSIKVALLEGISLPASRSDLITECASTVDGSVQSFIATDGNQLVAAFKGIAASLTRPRIAR
jgi:hypothetical protein